MSEETVSGAMVDDDVEGDPARVLLVVVGLYLAAGLAFSVALYVADAISLKRAHDRQLRLRRDLEAIEFRIVQTSPEAKAIAG